MNNQEAIKILDNLKPGDYSNPYEKGEAIVMAISALQAQEANHSTESSLTRKELDSGNGELATDCISRQAVIDALMEKDKKLRNINWYDNLYAEGECEGIDEALSIISNLPSVQPTLYGYDIEHLILIANVLRKENLPPERVVEALTDIGRIVSIVTNEFEESLRKAVEQCKI